MPAQQKRRQNRRNNLKASTKAVLFLRHNKCSYCGKKMERDEITKDHFVPRGEGGRDHFINQPPVCTKCNAEKSTQHPTELVASIEGMQQLKNFHDALATMVRVSKMNSQKISKLAQKWDDIYGGKDGHQ